MQAGREQLLKIAFMRGAIGAVRKMIPAIAGKAPTWGQGLGKGLGREMLTQAGAGAALGGLLEGGINAATAEEGQRGSAFAKGLAHGAATGAAAGAMTAPITTGARNLRLKGLTHMAGGDSAAAQQALDRGYLKTLRDVAKPSSATPLGRRGALFEAAAAPATLAAEMAVPTIALSGMMGEPAPSQPPPSAAVPGPPGQLQQMQPPQPKYASDGETAPSPINPLWGTALGGPLGGAAAEGLLRHFVDDPKLGPADTVLRGRLLPALGGALGVIGGYYGVDALNQARGATLRPASAVDPALYGAGPSAVPLLASLPAAAPPAAGAPPLQPSPLPSTR